MADDPRALGRSLPPFPAAGEKVRRLVVEGCDTSHINTGLGVHGCILVVRAGFASAEQHARSDRHADIKVEHILRCTKLPVERDCLRVAAIGLNEDDVGSARSCNGFQLRDQRRRDALAAMRGRHREIVDVDFAALALELFQLIRGKPAYNVAVL